MHPPWLKKIRSEVASKHLVSHPWNAYWRPDTRNLPKITMIQYEFHSFPVQSTLPRTSTNFWQNSIEGNVTTSPISKADFSSRFGDGGPNLLDKFPPKRQLCGVIQQRKHCFRYSGQFIICCGIDWRWTVEHIVSEDFMFFWIQARGYCCPRGIWKAGKHWFHPFCMSAVRYKLWESG